MAEVLVKVAFGIPCNRPAVFMGLSRLTVSGEGLWYIIPYFSKYPFFHFQLSLHGIL